jgi:hypothetical protein
VVRAALLLKTGASGTPAHKIVATAENRLEPTALRAVTLNLYVLPPVTVVAVYDVEVSPETNDT